MGRPRKNSVPIEPTVTVVPSIPTNIDVDVGVELPTETITTPVTPPAVIAPTTPISETITTPKRTSEDRNEDRNERLKKLPKGSLCPFLRSMCVGEKCVMWVGLIKSEDDEEELEINRCGFVFGGQNQMNTNQLLALIIARAEEDEDEDEIDEETETDEEGQDAVYKEISKKSKDQPIVDLDF